MNRTFTLRQGLGCKIVAAVAALAPAGCTGASMPWSGPVVFDTAQVWIHTETDSTRLQVELARTHAQQTAGLSGRTELEPGSGMLFLFDEQRPDTAGFWMRGTEIPLDIAFLDEEGWILEILAMDPCENGDPDDCPVYRPGVPYWSALEVRQGWFAREGIRAGARVGLEGITAGEARGGGP